MAYDSQANSEKNTPLKISIKTKPKKMKKAPKKPVKSGKAEKKVSKLKVGGKVKTNLINKSGINSMQKKRLIEHSVNHSKRHINFMLGKIENGQKFSEAHMLAQKVVGK